MNDAFLFLLWMIIAMSVYTIVSIHQHDPLHIMFNGQACIRDWATGQMYLEEKP